jgi:hypothetical protein
MYRKIYECQVKMWQIDATGKRALKWITMPVEKARQRADVALRCFECRGPNQASFARTAQRSASPCGTQTEIPRLFVW